MHKISSVRNIKDLLSSVMSIFIKQKGLSLISWTLQTNFSNKVWFEILHGVQHSIHISDQKRDKYHCKTECYSDSYNSTIGFHDLEHYIGSMSCGVLVLSVSIVEFKLGNCGATVLHVTLFNLNETNPRFSQEFIA